MVPGRQQPERSLHRSPYCPLESAACQHQGMHAASLQASPLSRDLEPPPLCCNPLLDTFRPWSILHLCTDIRTGHGGKIILQIEALAVHSDTVVSVRL